jgi:hypothetical protein
VLHPHVHVHERAVRPPLDLRLVHDDDLEGYDLGAPR